MAQPRKWSTPNQSATVGTRKKVTAVMAKAAARQRRPCLFYTSFDILGRNGENCAGGQGEILLTAGFQAPGIGHGAGAGFGGYFDVKMCIRDRGTTAAAG